MADVHIEETSTRPDVWGSAVASGDAIQLSKMVLEWSASKHEVALCLLRKCIAVLEEDLANCAGPRPPPSLSARPDGVRVCGGPQGWRRLDLCGMLQLRPEVSRALHNGSLPPRCGFGGCMLANLAAREAPEHLDRPKQEPRQTSPSIACCLHDDAVPMHCAGFVQNTCLDAFAVVLNQSCEGSDWFASTKELQLVSLQLCAACRNVATLTLRVDAAIPRRLLAAADAPPPGRKRLCSTRVPRLRARRVLWDLPNAVELRRPLHALADAIDIEFDCGFRDTLEGVGWPHRLHALTIGCHSVPTQRLTAAVVWPASLRQLTFGDSFNQPVERFVWPGSLQQLTFGDIFNQPIEGVMFPKSLHELTLGDIFDQPIEGVVWPASLRQLIFGDSFDQPVERVVWPAPLQQLTFGMDFNQPIKRLVWPVSLQQLTFGERFNQPIEEVVWPVSLQQLIFGNGFDQPIEASTWPGALRKLAFGQNFNQPIKEVRWPTYLEDLSFGRTDSTFSWVLRARGVLMKATFDQAICGARWPESLRRLSLGGEFSSSCIHLGVWMPGLEELTLLLEDPSAYRRLLHGIEWPKTLRMVTLFDDARLDGVTIPRKVQVVRLTRYREPSNHYALGSVCPG